MKLDFNIIVEPCFGLYGFLLATILSLVWTHIIIHYHRHTRHFKISKAVDTQSLGSKISGKSTLAKYVVLLLLFSCGVLIIYGATVESFEFTVAGAAGMVLKEKSHSYSLISLGNFFYI